jgi:DNA-binding protein HU-beta
MIKVDIVNHIVTTTGISRARAERAVDAVFDRIKRALAEGDRIELRRFGVFTVRTRKTGVGRNPRTGEEAPLPPGKAVRFRAGKELKSL